MIHVIIKIRDRETYFDGQSFPHYEVGWKKDDEFHTWSGTQLTPEDIEAWKEI